MLFKSFALLAAFAAFAPVFAAPMPATGITAVENAANDFKPNTVGRDSASFDEVVKMFELSRRDDSGCTVVEIDGIIYNVLNNATISILKRTDCNAARATAEVRDVVNKLNALNSQSKRSEEKRYSLAEIEEIVTMEANNRKSTESKRDKRDVTGVVAIVRDVLNNLDSNILSKRSTYSVSTIATAVKNVLDGVTKRTDNTANVGVVEEVLDELYAQAA